MTTRADTIRAELARLEDEQKKEMTQLAVIVREQAAYVKDLEAENVGLRIRVAELTAALDNAVRFKGDAQ